MAMSQVRSVLEREITCALCLDIFQDPKKLTCDHVFCKGCLEHLAKRNVTTAISCPECRKLTELPNGVVKDLPTAFHMNRLIDAFQQVQEREESDTTHRSSGTALVSKTSTNPRASTSTQAAPQVTTCKPSQTRSNHNQEQEVGRDDIFRSDSQTSEWQRMRAVREREQHTVMTGRSQQSGRGNERATTFSQFFSQLKTEWNVLVQGIKQFRRSHSQESRPRSSPPVHRASTAATTPATPQHHAVTQGSVSPEPNSGTVTQLLRAKNHEIGVLYQELQAKCQQEEQQKHKVDTLKRQVQELSDQGVAMGQRQEMKQTRRTSTMKEQIRREQSKSKQLEMEMDCLKRQLQELNMRQLNEQQDIHHQTSRAIQQQEAGMSFTLELPNTLNYRIIARHPQISGKLIDYAKSHGVQIGFTETESNIQATLTGIPEAFAGVQTNLLSLDHQLQEKLGIRYQQMHCAILPLLFDPSVPRALADIESKYHIEICIADSTGTVVSIKQFIQLLQSECTDRLLLTADLKNISVPDVRIATFYSWNVKNDQGDKMIVLPSVLNEYLNKTFFVDNKNEAEFEFNGMHYTANVSLMCITEVETGVKMTLDVEPVAPLWSYAISDDEYIVHEANNSEALENMYRYGGAFITLAGSKHVLDLAHMHQTDLETGHRVAIKRDPMLENVEAPQYFIIFAIRGLQNSLELATQAVQRKLKSFCQTVNFIANLLPTIPQDWQDIILVQMLNTARQYCLKIGPSSLENAKIVIELKGAKDVLDKVQVLLNKQTLEIQHQVISQQQSHAQDNYPPEWEPQKHDFELVAVNHKTSEWKSVKTLMKQSLGNIEIVQLQRIQNRQLWDKYALEMKHMSERNNGTVNEMKLFHGTTKTDPKVIVRAVRGIDFRYSRRDYQLLWGTGAYFAVNASYSDRYCYIDSSSGMKQLLLVRVLTGNSCSYEKKNDPSLTKPPPLSRGSHVLYDTVNGYTKGSRVYVVYDHDRAYPAYLITYLEL